MVVVGRRACASPLASGTQLQDFVVIMACVAPGGDVTLEKTHSSRLLLR